MNPRRDFCLLTYVTQHCTADVIPDTTDNYKRVHVAERLPIPNAMLAQHA